MPPTTTKPASAPEAPRTKKQEQNCRRFFALLLPQLLLELQVLALLKTRWDTAEQIHEQERKIAYTRITLGILGKRTAR